MREILRLWVSRLHVTLAVWLSALCMAALLCTPALALLKYGPVQFSGNVETQNLVRHASPDEYQFIQNRNTFRLRIDFDWLQHGVFLDKVDVPFIERSKLFLLYRGVFDGFYYIAPHDLQHGQERADDLVGGRITDFSQSQRGERAFESSLREAYVDTKLKDLPLSFRIGRQQVIWGESDQFRIMDIWNPLDITWHFQQESWDNIRIPLWLAKGLWDIGTLGPFSNTFVEVVYNPFDFQPGIKAGFLPLPWALPFPDPLRGGQVQQLTATTPVYLSPSFNLNGTSYQKGDFQRNPQDASEVGLRAHAVTPFGLEFSVDYLYGRARGVGANSPFAAKLLSVRTPANFVPANALPNQNFVIGGSPKRVFPALVDAQLQYPYMHIFGLTGNYFEEDYTQAVLRFESAYALGEPNQSIADSDRVNIQNCSTVTYTSSGTPVLTNCTPSSLKAPLGYTKRDLWTGMIGFDRPTWIRWLNSKATWFLSGQFFWNYYPGNVNDLVGNAGASDIPYFTPHAPFPGSNTGGFGVWQGGPFNGQTERLQNSQTAGNGDQIRRWEHLITFAATTFYRGGTIVPFIANAWDPVNDNNETLWNVDYYFTNNFIITLQQKFFYTYGSKAASNDPWYAGGRFDRRDETGLKLTYQF
jgi:hypothetical protein